MPISITQVTNVFITKSLIVRKLTGIVRASVFDAMDKTTLRKTGIISFLSLIKNGVRPWKKDNYYFAFHLWSRGYYHWLTEVAVKLVLFEQEIRKGVLVVPEAPPPFMKDFIALFDFPRTKEMKGNCFVRQLSVIGNPVSGHPSPAHIQQLRKFILDKTASTGKTFEKIYISRKLARARKVVNEQELINLLKQKGFHCVELENIPWAEQVNLFRGCHTLLSIHGAGLTNLILMPDGAKVIEIYPENPSGKTYPNPCYETLSGTVNVTHNFLFAKREENGTAPDFHRDNVIVDLEKITGIID